MTSSDFVKISVELCAHFYWIKKAQTNLKMFDLVWYISHSSARKPQVLMENELFLVIQHTKVLRGKHDIIGTKTFQLNVHNVNSYIIKLGFFFFICLEIELKCYLTIK